MYMGAILWDVITLGSYISKTIYLIFMKLTGINQQVIESLNIIFRAFQKFSKM